MPSTDAFVRVAKIEIEIENLRACHYIAHRDELLVMTEVLLRPMRSFQRKLFAEFFPMKDVQVESHGNIFALLTFLEGLALEEVRTEELDYHDSRYELLITVRATKPHAEISA